MIPGSGFWPGCKAIPTLFDALKLAVVSYSDSVIPYSRSMDMDGGANRAIAWWWHLKVIENQK